MKTNSRLAALQVLCLCCVLMIPGGARAVWMKTHTSSRFHWQIECPRDWQEQKPSSTDFFTNYRGPANTVGFTTPDGHGSMFVSVIKAQRLDLRGFMRAMLGVIMPLKVSLKIDEISGGYDSIYGQGSKGGQSRVVMFYKGGMRYTILFAGFDSKPGMYAKNKPTLDAIVKSFQIAKS